MRLTRGDDAKAHAYKITLREYHGVGAGYGGSYIVVIEAPSKAAAVRKARAFSPGWRVSGKPEQVAD
jgi:hypothetical protein